MTLRNFVDADVLKMCDNVTVRVPMFGRMFNLDWHGRGAEFSRLFTGSTSGILEREIAYVIPTEYNHLTIELKIGEDPRWQK